MQHDLIDIKTVAKMLGGLNPEHVRSRILKRPDFPRPFRISGRVLLDRDEVQEWIEQQRAPRITQKSRNNDSKAA